MSQSPPDDFPFYNALYTADGDYAADETSAAVSRRTYDIEAFGGVEDKYEQYIIIEN